MKKSKTVKKPVVPAVPVMPIVPAKKTKPVKKSKPKKDKPLSKGAIPKKARDTQAEGKVRLMEKPGKSNKDVLIIDGA